MTDKNKHMTNTSSIQQYVGKTNTANNGMQMEIIKYRENSDIDVKFKDGTIVRHRTYSAFKKGSIRHPKLTPWVQKHLGETRKNDRFNINMSIIDAIHSKDITIRFEDGYIVEHQNYNDFKRDRIPYPPKCARRKKTWMETHLKEQMKNTMMNMTIKGGDNSEDLTIEFEDGSIANHKQYFQFKQGKLGHPLYSKTCNPKLNEIPIGCIQIQRTAYKTDTKHFFCKCSICNHEDIYDWKEIHAHNALHGIPAEHLTYQYIFGRTGNPMQKQ